MNTAKPSTRPLFLRVFFINLLFCLLIDGGAYWLLQTLTVRVGALPKIDPPLPEIVAATDWVQMLNQIFWPYFVPASAVFFVLITLLMVLFLKGLMVPRQAAKQVKKKAVESDESKAEKERQARDANQRLFLHLITVLQKEGRLLDFFSEDLSQYEDGQIGAAVRNIHENCKKALEKQVAPQAVLEHNEGDAITVEQDFDPNIIKLVGNVTGKPPFKGIVQHRGWRARKLDLPTFSGQQATDIIAPAEVEVQ